jgi:hypothetical protein
MAYVRGTIGTEDLIQQDTIAPGQQQIDVSDIIEMLEKDVTPLVTISMQKAKKKATDTFEFVWWEKDVLEFRNRLILAAYGAGVTVWSVGATPGVPNATAFKVGDLVKVPRTGEVVRVTAVDTVANTITVPRAFGETAAAPTVLNEPILIFSYAAPQGGDAPDVISQTPDRKYNYTQIFKHTFGVTGTLQSSKLYTGSDLNQQQIENLMKHKVAIENQFIFGERTLTQIGGNTITATRGIIRFLEDGGAYIKNVGGALTETVLEEFMESAFRYGSKQKIFICSRLIGSYINSFARDKIRIVKDTSTYGIKVARYDNIHGSLDIVIHDHLEGATYGGYGIVIDPANIYYRPLNGDNGSRDTKLIENIQLPSADERKDMYITEAGLQLILPKTFAMMKGVVRV